MRTIVDIPEDKLAIIAELCKQNKMSRADLIRKSLDLYLETHQATGEAFGVLVGTEFMDGVEFQNKIRNEWSE